MARPGPKPRLATNRRRPLKAETSKEWPIPDHLGAIARAEFIRRVRSLPARGAGMPNYRPEQSPVPGDANVHPIAAIRRCSTSRRNREKSTSRC
jgi:hypothetical protein